MHYRELGNILRISRCFETFRRQQMKDVELHPMMALFVSHICRKPGCTQKYLVERLCLDKTTVAHALAKLEDKGYVEQRTSEEDARCKALYPTEKAMELAPRLHESYDAFYNALVSGLSEEDHQEIDRLTTVMYNNAYQLIKEAK